MLQDAIVVKIIDNAAAEVRVERGSACGSACVSCKGCAYKGAINVVAVNKVSAGVGDRVLLESKTSKILGAALLLYILPFFALFAGYALASALGLPENASALAGIGALIAGISAIALTQRKKKDFTFEIIAKNLR